MMCEKIQQSGGNMIIPMCQGLTGAIINIILDPLMIFGIGPFPEMGIRGAALATVIGQIFGMALGLWGVFRQQKVLNVNMREFKWRGQTIKDIYRVGLPGIVMQSVVSVMTAGMNGILIAFSQTAVNVLGVYFKLQTFVFMPVFGLNQGALPVMGYNYGARNRKRLMETPLYEPEKYSNMRRGRGRPRKDGAWSGAVPAAARADAYAVCGQVRCSGSTGDD